MGRPSLLVGLFALASIANGLTTSHLELMESLRGIPQGWKIKGTPEKSSKLHLRVAVTQQNQDLFEETLLQIATPSHSRYGKHLKQVELKDLIRPSQKATDSVVSWLKASGVAREDIVEDGEWIEFITTVSHAERMMDTEFKVYQSLIDPAVTKLRTLHYSVPRQLHDHIDMIQPTTRFAQIRPQRSTLLIKEKEETAQFATTALNATFCNTTITPTCLKELYNFASFKPNPRVNNLLGVNGFLDQYARYSDLDLFLNAQAPWAKGANFTFTSVNGGLNLQNSSEDSAEASLDIQYTVSLSYPTRNNFYSTPGRGPLIPDLDQPTQADNANEPYLELFSYLTSLPDAKLPKVLSTSYGEDEQSVPEAYSKNVCNMIGQLGARGVSVIFSSGDTGVGSACQTNDGKNTTRFLPIFPASCPYVTSVGGTYQVQPERAVYFSSGGFSDRWPTPKWQKEAVAKYLSILGDRWKGLYNPKGRGFPDIAAQGLRYRIYDHGQSFLIGGTSASAPTIAAIVSNINSARLSAGKPSLGWLNPWLYSEGHKGLTDVVDGGSTGCTGRDIYSGLPAPYVPYASWNATKGWDPVTGYGTPDFGKLVKIALRDGY